MTSSPELRLVSRDQVCSVTPLPIPDLRGTTWARSGGSERDDVVTESILVSLAEETRHVARAQGWSTGWSQGVRVARDSARTEAARLEQQARQREAERDAALATAIAGLAEAAAVMEQRVRELQERVVDEALDLALAVSEAVLGHTAELQPAADVVRRALLAAPADHGLVLRLSPVTAAQVDTTTLPSSVEVLADPALQPGDAMVDLEDSLVDLRCSTAVARVREALS